MATPSTQDLLGNPDDPVGLEPVTAPIYPAGSTVLRVGASEAYKTLAAAVAASQNGDVILVDAGTYINDFVQTWNKLTIIGVGGMVNEVATEPPPNEKAILTTDNDLTLENFSFSGAAIPADEGGNAAGIRYEAGTLTLINDSFTGNQNGILGGAGVGAGPFVVNIDHSYFDDNGSGSGNTHNIYIGGITQLNVTNSIFAEANVGHELKSRALQNNISDNLFYDGPTGTASYDIDLPNGGVDTVTDNVIEKGPESENDAMVHFGGEGLPYAASSLVVQGNTFENDLGSNAIGVLNQSGLQVTIEDNAFDDIASSNVVSGPAVVTGNVDQNGNPLADSDNNDPVPGSTLTETDDNPHTVILDDGSVLAVRGGGGLLTVDAVIGHIEVIGGSGGIDYTEEYGSGANQITTAPGSTNTMSFVGEDDVDSQGNDTITTGPEDVTITISGTATIEDGTGFDQLTVTGTADVIGHGGGPFVNMSTGSTVNLTGTLSSLHLQNVGGSATIDITDADAAGDGGPQMSVSITGGSSSLVIADGISAITTAPGAEGAVIRLGDGDAQISSDGPDTIYAGAGRDTVTLTGNSVVYAGSGQLTVVGAGIPAGSDSTVYGDGGLYVFGGNTGNIDFYAGAQATTVQAGVSNISLNGGAGLLTVIGGLSERVAGGAGGLIYDAQGGSATISTAAGASDVLKLGSDDTIDSWGTDTILGGSGNDNITAHGNASILGGTGNRTITLMGKDTLAGLGNDGVTVTRGATAKLTVGNSDFVHETGATVNIGMAGSNAGAAKVIGGSAWIYASRLSGMSITTDSNNATSVSLGTGAVTVTTYGTDMIHGSSGTDQVRVASANVQVSGGSGAMTVIEANSNAQHLKFVAGSGTADVQAWNGGTDLVFGTGRTTVETGGAGANTFEFIAGRGGGTDVISGFNLGTDRLSLQGGVTVAAESVSGGAATLVLSDQTHVQLVGVTNLSQLMGIS